MDSIGTTNVNAPSDMVRKQWQDLVDKNKSESKGLVASVWWKLYRTNSSWLTLESRLPELYGSNEERERTVTVAKFSRLDKCSFICKVQEVSVSMSLLGTSSGSGSDTIDGSSLLRSSQSSPAACDTLATSTASATSVGPHVKMWDWLLFRVKRPKNQKQKFWWLKLESLEWHKPGL